MGWNPERLSVLPHLSIFLIGSLAALIHIRLSEERKDQFKKHMEIASILAILIIILSFNTAFHDSLWNIFFGTDMPILPKNHWIYLVHGFLWGIFLVCHLHGQGWMQRLLSATPLRYVGTISFGIYLWHIAVLGYLNAHLNTSNLIKFLSIFAVTIGISTVTYFFIEKPMMRLKLTSAKSRQ